jgi:hypothetical protein
MPNGTLCGKAVVDMLLASEKGADMAEVQRNMVAKGDIPELYLLTEDRIKKAKKLPSVRVQDEEGYIGNFEAKQVSGNVKRLV